VENACDRFLEFLRVERNLALTTLEAYASDLGQLRTHLATESIMTPQDVKAVHLARWLQGLSEAGRASSSQSRALSAVRRFFAFLEVRNEIVCSPLGEIRGPKLRRKLPQILSRRDVQLLLEAPDTTHPRGQRDSAALELLYASGLRSSELCGLKVSELRLNLGVVCPRGKGNKERVIPMGRPAIAALEQYLGDGRLALLKGKASSYVFIGNKAKPLSRMGLYKFLQRYAVVAGISKDISPHMLRHAFATHLLQGGADLRSVQEMLGHADLATTEIYTHVDSSGLQKTVNRHHPLGREPKVT